MIRKSSKIIILLLLLVLAYGCTNNSGSSKTDSIKGSEGLTIDFLKGNPQERYVVSDVEEPISIILELRNKGSYPDEEDENILGRGSVHISGFDTNIIQIDSLSERVDREFLTGRSSLNPEGGFDDVEFKGTIYPEDLIVDRYEPTILATLCYPYKTKASPSVCIDPFPFDESQDKVCRIGSTKLSSQGAPIAITSIEQEASASKIQFKINIKNSGKGDVIKFDALDKCDPTQGELFARTDFDKIILERASVGFSELRCGPFPDGNGIIRLNNGEGFILCSIDKESYENEKSAYTTPLNLEIKYGYRITETKPIRISKVTTTS
ncbi:hypothetical protein ISS07_06840 [Candidatus Woesearchaeota archaeon]|nr:hypothetical protein [Candidatus Woesearchaeota archaeon]